ncbi:uncharacterized protein LOC116723962 isoform X1 [Xiphophorus hellerii]|uniref:uncharacterized protein LOC116723962 isoform X1 n=1 Tax=Xiphophorus hellerii TaxID=8084 RepID=UPI0013B3CE8D|nr:uncharacterized protein LOC116723962 isoform X1 [Xiphophorus hellerii]XP_032425100.1 uncharacterized protein LOC116723962 isoform X1 [Xiphophorus hellerii]
MQRIKSPSKVSDSKCPPSSSTSPARTPAPLPRTKLRAGPPSLDISSAAVRNCTLDTIISRSTLIQSGNPSVYQLRPKKEKSAKLTKLTVGEKDGCKRHKTILLVGETGAGKSTFINALANFTMGVKFQDEVWFQIVEEVDHETSEVIVYEIFGFEGKAIPYSLSIIDTPGFGSTRGIEHDVNISQRLLDLFQSMDGVHAIHGVGLVMKASDNRLSDRLMYILNSIMSLFGKNIEDNIVALITHSNGRTPNNVLQALEVSTIKCAKNEKKQPVYFLFNNCQSEDRNELAKYLEGANKITEKGLTEFTAFLEKAQPQNVKATVVVIKERSELTACIQNLQERIIETEQKQEQIRQIQHDLIKYKEEMKKNEHFTIEIEESYKVKEPINAKNQFKGGSFEGAMCCTRCEENCHYPGCILAPSPAFCDVITAGHCIVCSGKCPTSDHVKENWRYVTKTRKVKMTLKEIKQKYDNSKTEREKNLSYLESLETKIKHLTAKKHELLDESYKHVVKLEKIALKVDSASTLVHLDFLIEKMEEKGDKKVHKLERIKRNMDEGSRAALQYQHIAENQL